MYRTLNKNMDIMGYHTPDFINCNKDLHLSKGETVRIIHYDDDVSAIIKPKSGRKIYGHYFIIKDIIRRHCNKPINEFDIK